MYYGTESAKHGFHTPSRKLELRFSFMQEALNLHLQHKRGEPHLPVDRQSGMRVPWPRWGAEGASGYTSNWSTH